MPVDKKEEQAAAQQQPLRIFLVENDPVNQKLALRVFIGLGCQPATLDNGTDLLKALNGGEADVVLMDMDLPDMNGCEIARRIRNTADHQPYLAGISETTIEDRSEMLTAGINEMIQRPIRVEDVEAVLKAAGSRLKKGKICPAVDMISLNIIWEDMGGLSGDAFTELAGLFMKEAPEQMAEMRLGLEQADMELVRRAAHTLKGSSGALGAVRFSTYCRTLEKMARSGNFSQGKEAMADIENEYQSLMTELIEIISGFTSLER